MKNESYFTEKQAKAYDVVRAKDSTIFAFGGRLGLTNEMVEDLAAYYNIQSEDLFSYVWHILQKENHQKEVDIIIRLVPSFFGKKETIYSISIVDSVDHEMVLSTYYASMGKIENAPKNYPFPRLDDPE